MQQSNLDNPVRVPVHLKMNLTIKNTCVLLDHILHFEREPYFL